MKKVILMMAFAIGMTGAYAQKTVKVEKTGNDTEETTDSGETETMPLPDKEDARRSPSTGDLFDGLTRPVAFDRMIPPYALEVTFNKTVHLIFPAAIKYVDLGSADILAGIAIMDEVFHLDIQLGRLVRILHIECIIAAVIRDHRQIRFTGEVPQRRFHPKYVLRTVREAVNRPNNSQEIYLTELGSESPLLVRLIMKSVYDNNKRLVKHIGCKRFGIQYILKGIYTHNGLLYFHTELKNASNVPFSVDFVTFKVVDKKVAKRTAIQEQVIVPLRAFNYVTAVDGKSKERTVFTLPKFTLPDDKQLVVEMNEQNGGRHQRFILTNAELIRARVINELKVK